MNDTKNTNKELHEAFDNFRAQTAEAIAACEAFIAMDINAPRAEVDRPREAISTLLIMTVTKGLQSRSREWAALFPTMMVAVGGIKNNGEDQTIPQTIQTARKQRVQNRKLKEGR